MLFFRFSLVVGLFALYPFVIPYDKMAENTPCRFQIIDFGSLHVPSYSGLPSLAVAPIFGYLFHSVFHLRFRSACYIFRRSTVFSFRRIAHCLQWIALLRKSRPRCIVIILRLRAAATPYIDAVLSTPSSTITTVCNCTLIIRKGPALHA